MSTTEQSAVALVGIFGLTGHDHSTGKPAQRARYECDQVAQGALR